MVDITAKLIWYRLGETYSNMAENYGRFQDWYQNFSWTKVDILDMFFLGWILLAFIVVGVINILLKFFGPPKARTRAQDDQYLGFNRGDKGGLAAGETCRWVNSTISWLYVHYDCSPELLESWLRALNEQARKLGGGLQVKFDRVQGGSLPPKFTDVKAQADQDGTLSLTCHIEATDASVLVSILQPVSSNVGVSQCDIAIQKLEGQLKVHSRHERDEVHGTISFVSRPTITLQVKPRNYENNVDLKTLDDLIQKAIGGAVTNVNFTALGAYQDFFGAPRGDLLEPRQTTPRMTTPHMERRSEMSLNSAKALRDRRLLVKVIKANGLGNKEFGCADPYCIVSMDEPPQKHTTSVVKNTINPFWDEHFLFDLDEVTRQVKFELYDREKPPGDDFLGFAIIPMDDLRRNQSSRQIIPLQGRTSRNIPATGSVTVEFLFMEPAEAQRMQLDNRQDDSLSPRRRIETNRTVLPGGTKVTTTTTTTEKLKDGRIDASFGVPATQHQPRYMESPRLTVTAADKRSATLPSGGSANIPVIKMTESTPTEEIKDSPSMSTTSGSSEQKEIKKSRSFASTLKKRFTRAKKPRSHSADRASSMRDENLLKPPDHKTTDDLDQVEVPGGTMRKSRSHSFSSSLRKLFKKKKKDTDGFTSRDSSISRSSRDRREVTPDSTVRQHSPQPSYTYSREGSVTQPSPQLTPRESMSVSLPVSSHLLHDS